MHTYILYFASIGKKVQNAIYWYPSSTIFIAENLDTVAKSHYIMVVHLRQMPGAQPKLLKLFFNVYSRKPTISEVNFSNNLLLKIT